MQYVVPKNIYTPLTEGIGISGEGRGSQRPQKFQAMYEAQSEFPEGWGDYRANPFYGGYGYFLELQNCMFTACRPANLQNMQIWRL